MINVKNDVAIKRMEAAGNLLSEVFERIIPLVQEGISTGELDRFIENELALRNLVSGSKGYKGFAHVSCISINDEVVHGIPNFSRNVCAGDLVKIDVSAAFNGYFVDMARSIGVGRLPENKGRLAKVAYDALECGIKQAVVGNRLSDISAAIQAEVERQGFAVVRDFAGHGIGRSMHEDPEIVNYGKPGRGPVLVAGMAFALEPMITEGSYRVYVADDGWTAKTVDGSCAAHVEDTVIVTQQGPMVVTRSSARGQ